MSTESIFKLLSDTLELQSELLTVSAETTLFNDSNLNGTIIQTLRLCKDQLWEKTYQNIDRPYVSDNKLERTFKYFASAVAFMRYLVMQVRENEANYFGAFSAEIVTSEVRLIVDLLAVLVHVCNLHEATSVDPFSILYKSDRQLDLPTMKTENLERIDDTSTYNLTGRIFWAKHFGRSMQVRWEEFWACFETLYGEQRIPNMEKFQRVVADRSAELGFCASACIPFHAFITTISCNRSRNGSADNSSSQQLNSLFAAYSNRCDETSVVVLCGSVYESVDGECCPRVVRSLLGLKIKQISCGDQHIAAISSEGILM